MNEIQLDLNDNGKGFFFIEKDGQRKAKMEIGISGSNLTVYHTEVADELQGQGIAAKLLATMVAYARANQLKIIPLCPYVQSQFKRHPDTYADVWNQQWHS
jgi:predicted GNAT family acetyltransferase